MMHCNVTSQSLLQRSKRHFCILGLLLFAILLSGCTGQNIKFRSTATPTPTPTPIVNGTCDLSLRNKCLSGLFKDMPDSSTHYQWACNGLRNGTSDFCQKHKPVEGICNTNIPDTCSSGAFQPQEDTSTHHKWQCRGFYSGKTNNCTLVKTNPGGSSLVNGVCNIVVPNTCSAGTFSDVTDTNTHYKWQCTGLNNGINASCQAHKPVNGDCGVTKETCNEGILENTLDSESHYLWLCHGQYGGRTRSCYKAKPVNGSCDNSKRNSCLAGTANDSAIDDDRTYYKWWCVGANGGTTIKTCTYNKPINGECGTTNDGCTKGTSSDLIDTSIYYMWACMGQYGGATQFCHLNKPEAGVCGASRNTCYRGSYIAGIDTTDDYKWSCNGKYGSTTNVTCTLPKITRYLVPEAPTDIQLIYRPSLRLSWELSQNKHLAEKYEVQWNAGSTEPSPWPIYSKSTSICEVNEAHCTLDPKSSDTVGYVRVRGVNSLVKGTWSSSTKIVWGNASGVPFKTQQLSSGDYYTCALTSSGGVKCWGRGDYGQLGNKSTSTQITPVDVHTSSGDSNPLSGVVQLVAGFSHTCALTSSGKVKCWGRGDYGQLGNKSTSTQTTPVDVHTSSGDSTPLSRVVQLSSGDYHTCALTSSGKVKCWGSARYGQLGNKNTTSQTTPVDVHTSSGDSTPLSGIVQLSEGDEHTCALMSSGKVKCWGWNNRGQVGNKSTSNQTTPVDVHTSSGNSNPLSGVIQLSAGHSHTCALTNSGGVKCWGWGDYGQLGNKSTSTQTTPVDVHTSSGDSRLLSGMIQLSAGDEHNCVVTSSGGVKCWGRGAYGELGNKSTSNQTTPVNVHTSSGDSTSLSEMMQVSGSDYHTCALTNSGKVKCWGRSNYGQLGNKSNLDQTTPVNVHTSSSDSSSLTLGISWHHYQCVSGTCTHYNPLASVSGSTATPTFTASSLLANDVVAIYTGPNCNASSKKGTATVSAGQTSASTTLASLGGSGAYKLYFVIQRSGYRSICLGPIPYTF